MAVCEQRNFINHHMLHTYIIIYLLCIFERRMYCTCTSTRATGSRFCTDISSRLSSTDWHRGGKQDGNKKYIYYVLRVDGHVTFYFQHSDMCVVIVVHDYRHWIIHTWYFNVFHRISLKLYYKYWFGVWRVCGVLYADLSWRLRTVVPTDCWVLSGICRLHHSQSSLRVQHLDVFGCL
jgi:hypothetical protein